MPCSAVYAVRGDLHINLAHIRTSNLTRRSALNPPDASKVESKRALSLNALGAVSGIEKGGQSFENWRDFRTGASRARSPDIRLTEGREAFVKMNCLPAEVVYEKHATRGQMLIDAIAIEVLLALAFALAPSYALNRPFLFSISCAIAPGETTRRLLL